MSIKELIKEYKKHQKKNIEFEIMIFHPHSILFYEIFNNLDLKDKTPEETYEYKFSNTEKYVNYSNKITLKKKEHLYSFNKNNLIFKIFIDEEKKQKSISEEIKVNRKRLKYTATLDEFKNWRFDLSINKIIKPNSNKNLEKEKNIYQVEVEYIGKEIPKEEDIENVYNFLYNYVIIDNVKNTLRKKSFSQIVNKPRDITLIEVSKIAKNYAVSEKADGERCLLYFDKTDIYSILKPFKIKKVSSHKLNIKKFSLLDSEYIPDTNKYYLFDILVNNNKNITNNNLQKRYKLLDKYKSKDILVKEIKNVNNDGDIYDLAEKTFKEKHPYEIDGLIFTPIFESYYSRNIYKWKPSSKLTIDFLIRSIKKTKTEETFLLFINCNRIEKIPDKYYDMFPFLKNKESRNYPCVFEPMPEVKLKMKFIKNKNIEYGNYNGIPIKDNTIVEFRYEDDKWIPERVRMDKTEGYLKNFAEGKYEGGPNYYSVAHSIWKLIQDPVTEDIIFGKNKDYYSKVQQHIKLNLYPFNRFLKRSLYNEYVKEGDNILEIAGGRGGDLFNIVKSGGKYVLLLDIVKLELAEAKDRHSKSRELKNLNVNFVEYDVLSNNINKIREVSSKKEVDKFDVISCQFAFHYFLGSKKSVDIIIKFVDAFLKDDGVFMFTGYNGQKVFDELKDKDKLEYFYNDKLFARITKKYTGKTFKKYGQEISVYVDKIGVEHDKEYLINNKYISEEFEKKGINLVKQENFSSMLDNFRKDLSEDEIKYISLHDYVIYKK